MPAVEDVPRDFASLRARIVERRDELPKRLAEVASFAVSHPDEIAFGTAASIASKANVQPSTLVRFSQAMGYQGFSELQAVFRQRFRDRLPDYEDRLKAIATGTAPAKLGMLLERFCEAGERSIKGLRSNMDPARLERAVEILAAADTIYVIGLRRSFPVASYMAYALGKLAIRTILVDGVAGLQGEVITLARPSDAVIAVSFTPYASETVTLAGAAADRGIPLVALTDSPFSPLALRATTWFEVVEADVEGFRSMAASFAIAMTISVAVAERRREAA